MINSEEKSVEKNLQKKWHVDIWRNSRFLAEFQLCGHFLINRKTSQGMVFINQLVKKL